MWTYRSSIVVAHNHPRGWLDPSPEDRQITEWPRSVGELVAIPMLDHLIFSHEAFISMVEQGYMEAHRL